MHFLCIYQRNLILLTFSLERSSGSLTIISGSLKISSKHFPEKHISGPQAHIYLGFTDPFGCDFPEFSNHCHLCCFCGSGRFLPSVICPVYLSSIVKSMCVQIVMCFLVACLFPMTDIFTWFIFERVKRVSTSNSKEKFKSILFLVRIPSYILQQN